MGDTGAIVPAAMRPKRNGGFFHERILALFITIILGCFSIFVTSEFRNFISSAVQSVVPVSAQKVEKGGYLTMYYFFQFLLLLGLFVILCVCLIPLA